MAQKGLWNLVREKVLQDTEERCLRKKVTLLENTRLCMKKIS